MTTKQLHISGSEEYYPSTMRFIGIVNLALVCMALVAVTSLVIQNGFYITTPVKRILNRIDFIVILYYLLQFCVKGFCARSKIRYLRLHWFETLLAFLIIMEITVMVRIVGVDIIRSYFMNIDVTAITEIYIGIAQLLIFLTLITGAIRYNRQISSLKFHPSRIILFSFAAVIFCGGGLLMLPRATFPGQSITFLDALFTSASATCVTGLTVVDTATYFTRTGQIIILALIQIGGLGIMTISSFLVLFFGKGIGLRERIVLREMLNLDRLGLITNILRNVVLLTFGIEAAGTLLLMVFWHDQGWPVGYLVYTALFHAVAAFCNAGFSTFTDSLCGFSGSVGVLGTISMLIIFGGLGFIVITDIGDYLVTLGKNRKQPFHLKIQTRLVILISSILIVAGTVLVYLIERISGNEISFLSALFISITARTAGFNSIDMSTLTCGSACIIIFLMFIGASPGSTGGGIKTTTAGVLAKSIFAIITGQNRIIIYHKTMPFLVLNRALVVFTFSVIVVAFMVFVLSLTEKTDMVNIIFEVVSAFGTVGLSRDLTPNLSVMGKIAIIGTMFIGRIGALTLAFAITQSDQTPSRVEYPPESIMVG